MPNNLMRLESKSKSFNFKYDIYGVIFTSDFLLLLFFFMIYFGYSRYYGLTVFCLCGAKHVGNKNYTTEEILNLLQLIDCASF